MVNMMDKVDMYSSILREHGLRVTEKRLGILGVLGACKYPVDVKGICEGLGNTGICVNLSTVYRALDSLVAVGVVNRMNFSGDSRVFYELSNAGHRHFLHCLVCGELVSVDGCPLGDYQSDLASETNYRVVGHHLDLYGYCPKCQVKK